MPISADVISERSVRLSVPTGGAHVQVELSFADDERLAGRPLLLASGKKTPVAVVLTNQALYWVRDDQHEDGKASSEKVGIAAIAAVKAGKAGMLVPLVVGGVGILVSVGFLVLSGGILFVGPLIWSAFFMVFGGRRRELAVQGPGDKHLAWTSTFTDSSRNRRLLEGEIAEVAAWARTHGIQVKEP